MYLWPPRESVPLPEAPDGACKGRGLLMHDAPGYANQGVHSLINSEQDEHPGKPVT